MLARSDAPRGLRQLPWPGLWICLSVSISLGLLGRAARATETTPPPSEPATAPTSALVAHGKRDAQLHDPSSIVRCGDTFWLFSTGRLVSSWHSDDLVTWHRGPSVFQEMPPWVRQVVPEQRGHFWAPDVIQLGDRYLLYYSVSSFGKNASAIALATACSLDPASNAYGWTDQGIVIQSSAADTFNAIDPAILQTTDGELWMAFGSFWSGLKLIRLDPVTGLLADPTAAPLPLAFHREIEAAHLCERDGWFYLFLNHGVCCRGVESTYEIRVGRSRSITGPYVDRDGVDLRTAGGTLVLASEEAFIGPGHANVTQLDSGTFLHCHFYDATARGRSYLAMMPLTWTANGWPLVITGEAAVTDTAPPAPR